MGVRNILQNDFCFNFQYKTEKKILKFNFKDEIRGIKEGLVGFWVRIILTGYYDLIQRYLNFLKNNWLVRANPSVKK